MLEVADGEVMVRVVVGRVAAEWDVVARVA